MFLSSFYTFLWLYLNVILGTSETRAFQPFFLPVIYQCLFWAVSALRHLQRLPLQTFWSRAAFNAVNLMRSNLGWVREKIAINHCLSLCCYLEWMHMTDGLRETRIRRKCFNICLIIVFSIFLRSCTAVLPHLPSPGANRWQTYPGTLHLRAFPCAPSSRVSLSLTHSNTRQNTADGTRERTWFSRIRCIAALLVAIYRSSSRTSFRLWAWSILLVGCWVPFFAF